MIRVGDKIVFKSTRKECIIEKICVQKDLTDNKIDWLNVPSCNSEDLIWDINQFSEAKGGHIYFVLTDATWGYPFEFSPKLPSIKVICTPK